MDLLYFWIGASITFLIIEMVTATFYGLSLAIASATVALYVWYTKETSLDVMQGVIFACLTFVASYTLPRLLVPWIWEENPQWADIYIGQTRKVKWSGDEYKVTLDGVDYTIESEDEINTGDKVKILAIKGIGFVVKKI